MKATLTHPKSKKKLSKPNMSIGTGECIFPFTYKKKIHTECVNDSKSGYDWCATEVDKNGKLLKYAFCDYGKKKSSGKKKLFRKKKNYSPTGALYGPSVLANVRKRTKKGKAKRVRISNSSKKSDGARPANEVSARPANEVSASPANEVSASPANEVSARPANEVSARPANEVSASPANEESAKMKSKKKMKKIFKLKPNFDIKSIEHKYYVPETDKLTHKVWTLPNKQTFPKWFAEHYKLYNAEKNSMSKSSSGEKFELFKHQKLVRDYLQVDSPYRGLLLFHGLGVGKTCASIAIAEGFRSERDIVIVLNKSLVKNFKVNLMQCGYEYFKKAQHWEFFDKSNGNMMSYSKKIGVTQESITKHGGAWLIDFDPSARHNYEALSEEAQSSIDKQIEFMIDNKYHFEHLNGLTRDRLRIMLEERFFDNKLIIFDEVHNLTNAISKPTPGVRGAGLKKLLMSAENAKLVFLSGTPMINNLFEVGQLFNLLRGYIINFQFKLNSSKYGKSLSFDTVVDKLKDNELVDLIIPKKSDNIINIVRPPYGFINTEDGVVKSDLNRITNDAFKTSMESKFKEYNYDVKMIPTKYTALPDNDDEFMSKFYDDSRNKLKNTELFKSRILGLVSYFRTEDKELLPTVTTDEVIEVPMSNYQFLAYSEVRKAEIDQDKSKTVSGKKTKPKKSDSSSSNGGIDIFEDKKSSYRAYSRMHCSFVFPESIPRPYPASFVEKSENPLDGDDVGQVIDIDVADSEEALEGHIPEPVEPVEQKDPDYETAKENVLIKLDSVKETLFTMDEEEQLLKYSPKYNEILKRIKSLDDIGGGLSFIYTEYKTLEGIGILKIILKANGYAEFKLEKNEYGEYAQVYEYDDDVDKPKYAFWGGDELESDIIRKIYNNQFDLLPPTIRTQMEEYNKTDENGDKEGNKRGQIISILMTTKTGAEGIDLQNVRQVHIVEPYWNPVRTEQVKGRAVRVKSHTQLPEKDRTVEIFTYLSIISESDLASDITIRDDKGGKTSDQVLFDISQKKLDVMKHLLQLIKEASIDCNVNLNETKSPDNDFTCMSYPSSVTSNNYSYHPNIRDDHVDSERTRRIEEKEVEYTSISLSLFKQQLEFKLKESDDDSKPGLLYHAEQINMGNPPGDPIGSYEPKLGAKSLIWFDKDELKRKYKKKKSKSKKRSSNSNPKNGGGTKKRKY